MSAGALVHSPKNAAGSWAGRDAAAALAVLLAVALCYANSLRVPFLLDDPLPGTRFSLRTRPLVGLSFELNRLVSGGATWSYHLFNAGVHALCGLVLLGVLRRALDLVAPARTPATRALALAVTLSWLCHPLQTATVTYVSQRAEALASLGVLGTLYGFLRALEPSARRWQVFAVASLAFGFLAKEVTATAPLLVLLAEVALVPGTLRANLSRRWRFHGVLWLVSGVLFLMQVAPLLFGAAASAGFGAERALGTLDYARSQPGVILHYLRLVVWPHPLVFDYGWPPARALGEWLPQTLALLVLLGVALGLLLRRAALGFPVAAFFVLLLPSSSVVPIRDLAFEHRMYLALAPALLVSALLVERARARLGASARALGLAALLVLLVLAGLTVRRNHDYRSAVALWTGVVEHAPHHARAYNNLAAALLEEGRVDEAERALARALELAPPTSFVHRNLARIAAERGQLDAAMEHLEQALALHDSAAARSDLALLLRWSGRAAESELHLRRALELEPARASDRLELARLLVARGADAEALAHLERLTAEPPESAAEHLLLGQALSRLARPHEALAEFRRASELDPTSAEARAGATRIQERLEARADSTRDP